MPVAAGGGDDSRRRTLIAIGRGCGTVLARVPGTRHLGPPSPRPMGGSPSSASRVRVEYSRRRPNGSDVQRLQPGSLSRAAVRERPLDRHIGRVLPRDGDLRADLHDAGRRLERPSDHARRRSHCPTLLVSPLAGERKVLFSIDPICMGDAGGTFIINIDGSHEHRVETSFGGAWAPRMASHIAYVTAPRPRDMAHAPEDV